MSRQSAGQFSDNVQSVNADGSSSVVLVCEHASHFIPPPFHDLGLPTDQLKSHVAWDPGALGVAIRLSEKLDAVLLAAKVSRLVYDCNRPPEASDAMPALSEVVKIPGNASLGEDDRSERTAKYYDPFKTALAAQLERTSYPVLVTVHSFTSTYHGKPRAVEIGILHDSDSRLADTMLRCAASHTHANVQRNQPYGAEHGVTHTLKIHALPGGHLNVMLEIRNDLIQTEPEQSDMADMIAGWIVDAYAMTDGQGVVQCTA